MLTVTVKTVKQQTVKVDVEETATTLDLKGQIQEALGAEFPAEHQKLIFKGKILQDTAIVGEIGLMETSFVVVMVSKPKSAVVPQPEAPPPPPVAPAEPVAQPAAPPEGASSSPALSQEQMIDNLMEMTGNTLPRSQVAEVLARTQNNPEVAGALLAGGIPESLSTGGAEAQSAPSTLLEGIQGVQSNPLSFLRSQPQFQQLRTVLQANPASLTAILGQIQQSNPDLYDLINNNREAFMQLINDPASGPGVAPTGTDAPPSGTEPTQIAVTPEDKAAIDRLIALGFPEHMVIQAYFACDKNEALAANFLLSDD